MCWGRNSNGQLGIGSTTDQYSPQAVDLDAGATPCKVESWVTGRHRAADQRYAVAVTVSLIDMQVAKDMPMCFMYQRTVDN